MNTSEKKTKTKEKTATKEKKKENSSSGKVQANTTDLGADTKKPKSTLLDKATLRSKKKEIFIIEPVKGEKIAKIKSMGKHEVDGFSEESHLGVTETLYNGCIGNIHSMNYHNIKSSTKKFVLLKVKYDFELGSSAMQMKTRLLEAHLIFKSDKNIEKFEDKSEMTGKYKIEIYQVLTNNSLELVGKLNVGEYPNDPTKNIFEIISMNKLFNKLLEEEIARNPSVSKLTTKKELA